MFSPHFNARAILPALCLLLSAAVSTAALAETDKPKKARSAAAAKANKSTKVKFDKGSGETTSERERRLYRECRGRPNAGACEGFAR